MIVSTLPYRHTLNNCSYYLQRMLIEPEAPPHLKARIAMLLEELERHTVTLYPVMPLEH